MRLERGGSRFSGFSSRAGMVAWERRMEEDGGRNEVSMACLNTAGIDERLYPVFY